MGGAQNSGRLQPDYFGTFEESEYLYRLLFSGQIFQGDQSISILTSSAYGFGGESIFDGMAAVDCAMLVTAILPCR